MKITINKDVDAVIPVEIYNIGFDIEIQFNRNVKVTMNWLEAQTLAREIMGCADTARQEEMAH